MTPRERAALHFAEKLAVDHHKVDDALWAEVRAAYSGYGMPVVYPNPLAPWML